MKMVTEGTRSSMAVVPVQYHYNGHTAARTISKFIGNDTLVNGK